jgi:hypothetical protein
MEERPQCIQMHNASNINNHGFIFQFWVNFRFKTLAQVPWAVAMHYHFCWISHIIPRRNIWWERDFFFFPPFWRIGL